MLKITHALLLATSLMAMAQTSFAPAASISDNKPNDAKTPQNKELVTGHTTETDSKPVLKDRAWDLLLSGIKESSTAKRATAVRVLSLLTGEARAVRLASHALSDSKPQVRVAAALVLGELHANSAIPKLEVALSDKEPSVALAAAHSLLTLKDATAYQVYYEILAGERKGSKGLVAGELDTLKDPRKMALLGFQEGIGFVPFAGIGYTAIRTIVKDDSSPVRAAAAKVLAGDPDIATEDALIQAATDKHELVRTAALDALARRGDPAVIDRIASALSDDKDDVKFTAAAAIVHLYDVVEHKKQKRN
jgi:HEAT repeat protein